MRTIHKFQLYDGLGKISLPFKHQVLSVNNQGNEVYMWVLLDTDSKIQDYDYYCAFTGQELSQNYLFDKRFFVGTVILDNGLVVHVFFN